MTEAAGVSTPGHWPKEPDARLLKSLVDTHAHPTDYKQFKDEKEEYRDFTSSLALRKVSCHLRQRTSTILPRRRSRDQQRLGDSTAVRGGDAQSELKNDTGLNATANLKVGLDDPLC